MRKLERHHRWQIGRKMAQGLKLKELRNDRKVKLAVSASIVIICFHKVPSLPYAESYAKSRLMTGDHAKHPEVPRHSIKTGSTSTQVHFSPEVNSH